MHELSGHGLAIDLPDGWDGRIYRRAEEARQVAHRALHAASFPLPTDPGDFAAEAVERMARDDILVTLVEYHPEAAGTALFGRELPPALRPESFDPNVMPRAVPGKAGAQFFFTAAGRAFCLFVVVGNHPDRARLVPQADAVVRTLRIEP